MATLTVSVPGMNCRHAIRVVTARLRDVPGVETVAARADTGVVELRGAISTREVLAALVACAYPGVVISED